MRKKLKRFRVLIFALSILFSLSLACPQYGSAAEIYLLPLDLNLENIDNGDSEDPGIGPPLQSRGIVSAVPVDLRHREIPTFRDSHRWPFQEFSSEPEISILRC